MFKWFKKRRPTSVTLTFAQRTRAFWLWFAERAPVFYDTIEAKRCDDLEPEVSGKIEELLPAFSWAFGPGENEVGHSFTLTGEGNLSKQLLTAFWKRQAPNLPGWTFHSTKQPNLEIGSATLVVSSQQFNPAELWLTPILDREEERIDVTIWHPLFPKMEERERKFVSYLFLDEALGEIAVENWIGVIELGDSRLAHALPLSELNSFVAKTASETGWEKAGPGEIVLAYTGKEPMAGSLRRDIVAGSAVCRELISDWEDGGIDPDPLEGTGADYVFVSFDRNFLTPGQEAHSRGEIEDALDDALKAAGAGEWVGGAVGLERAYIDLLLIDGDASLEVVQRVLREKGLPAGTMIEYFARSKQKLRRPI